MSERFLAVPIKQIGPILIKNPEFGTLEVKMPMATFESTLWPSTARGAKVARLCGGIQALVLKDSMARSVVVQAPNAQYGLEVEQHLRAMKADVQAVVEGCSRYAKFDDLHVQLAGRLLYLRLAIKPGDAAGHNMVTKCADHLLTWLLEKFPQLQYVSVSANVCTDKKVSAVNAVLGRGVSVLAELEVPRDICQKRLRATPEQLRDLHQYKNLTGSVLAGSLLSANAHFANILLATYLATGQDAANIVEGSQGMTHVSVTDNGDLHFAVNLPNLIVGTVGNGKHHDYIRHNLQELGLLAANAKPGTNRHKLALMIAATVLCGELSLMGALCNPGELMKSHVLFERDNRHRIDFE